MTELISELKNKLSERGLKLLDVSKHNGPTKQECDFRAMNACVSKIVNMLIKY
jgi:hypothetical protein